MRKFNHLFFFVSIMVAVSIASPLPNVNKKSKEFTVTNEMIYTANNAVGKKQDVEDDFAIQLSTRMSWEHLLSPAPLSIGLLGDLMIMSSEIKDFPIDGQIPLNGIRFVKYPKSFRTTLVQISNDGQRAFMMANNNMDKIRLLMGQVPGYMKEATEILVSGDQEIVADYLPGPMHRISIAAKSSVDLSKGVVLQFEYVMNLIFEVLEMCTSEKTVQEAKLETNINRQSVLNKTIPLFEQQVKQLNDSLVTDGQKMDNAEQDMRKALHDMPSGWDMIGMDFVQAVGSIATLGLLSMGGGSSEKNQAVQTNATNTSISNDQCIMSYSKPVFNLTGLASRFKKLSSDLKLIDSAKGKYNPEKDTSKLNEILTSVQQCEPLVQLINDGLNFVESIAAIANFKKPENMTAEELNERRQTDFNDSKKIAKEFVDTAKDYSSQILSTQQPVAAKTPFLSSAQQQPLNVQGTASQKALASCQYKADMAKATLFAIRESMEKTRAQMIEQNLHFINLLGEQQSLKLDNVRYDEIIKVLEEGIKKLGILKEHWTKLVEFFQKIANFVENVASTSIEDFHIAVDKTAKRKNPYVEKFVFDLLYTKALKATQAATVIHNMADIYVNVSSHYIMPSVASLSRFIVTDRKNATAERTKLLEKCAADSNAIVELIVAEKEKSIEKLQKRVDTFKKEFAFLDTVRENQMRKIREKAVLEVRKKAKFSKSRKPIEIEAEVEEMVDDFVQNDEFLSQSNNLIVTDAGEFR